MTPRDQMLTQIQIELAEMGLALRRESIDADTYRTAVVSLTVMYEVAMKSKDEKDE